MSTLAAGWPFPLALVERMAHRSSPVRNGIHDAIYRCANRQRIASICPARTCLGISGTNTCDGTNRLRSTVSRIEICQGDAMDGQNVCHRPSRN